jgi:hypothetical protein
MAVSPFTAGFIADEFIRANDLQPTCKADIILLHKQFGEDAQANKAALDTWLETRDHVRKTLAAKADELIDIALERTAFGPTATPGGRAKAYRLYGAELFEQRRLAWGASEGIIRSGTEPGGENTDAATVKKAAKIVADEFANSPFNPQKRYLTEDTRIADIARYVNRFGTKAAQKAANHFNVDLAARPLRKRA